MQTPTTAALKSLLEETDARIREQASLMARTPSDTLAWKAMNESRPGLLAFRYSLDAELHGRGA
jgi:hypothetical protein